MSALQTQDQFEPIATAPRDQGRELRVWVDGIDDLVRVYWWRNAWMPHGVWWSNEFGVVEPYDWLPQ